MLNSEDFANNTYFCSIEHNKNKIKSIIKELTKVARNWQQFSIKTGPIEPFK